MKRLRRIFLNLARVNVPSGSENRIMPPIIKTALNNGFKVSIDENFNVIAIRRNSNNGKNKNKLPLLCAHMDNISRSDDTLRREVTYDHKTGIITTPGSKDILGGDDKCGIAIILRLMELAPRYNYEFIAAFTRSEERGVGANKLNKNILKSVKWAIVLDRRNQNDIVTKIGSTILCSKEFADWISHNAPKEITPNIINSCFSDAVPLRSHGVENVVNLSTGYYEPHSEKEYVIMSELYNSFLWTENIIMHHDEM